MIRKEIESKEWQYYLFEKGDDIELSVPIAKPTPGFDVIHTLTQIEKKSYLAKGVTALQTRISDMKKKPSSYKMNSWR